MLSRPRQLRRIPLGLALLVAVTSLVGLGRPSAVLAWDTGAYSSSSERELIALTNRSRAAAGLRSLKVDRTLTSVARWRSRDMIERDYFSHDIPGYGNVFKKLDSKGYCYELAGENIGWNTYPDGDATAAIHEMFMDSSGHRRNILNRQWEVIGVGAFKGANGKKMWTVLFADKCGSTARSTPKPAAKATSKPKPKATPRPTHRATPRPTPKPTAKPTPKPTPSPTPVPTATPSPTPPIEGDAKRPADPAPPAVLASTETGLRVTTAGGPDDLVDAILGRVAETFFGA
ncbi:MAG TPA: CAP domain-containing protein [Candidatus Limnocylindrales bacterium]|nr:CAP domain-containing protein [Candidatus Limnocylindrales bacterium]